MGEVDPWRERGGPGIGGRMGVHLQSCTLVLLCVAV